MRIISGVAKGRKLCSPPAKNTAIRPTSDRAREALFNIIGQRTVGARTLDLFAGTGALGLEALSRGAAEVIFVDYHRTALELIKKNCFLIANDRLEAITVLCHDLRKGLPARCTAPQCPPFDLIFLDPPYAMGVSQHTLRLLSESDRIHPETLVVAEERSSEHLPETVGKLVLFDQRRYGDTGFWLYTTS